MLDPTSCQVDERRAALFEQYRKLAIGNVGPDIAFTPGLGYKKLSEIHSKLKLLVFGSSNCNKCQNDIPKLMEYYEKWKDKNNLEIVFISLDTDEQAYKNFIKDFKWISSTELKGWDSKASRDYYVFATPTLFLLDSDDRIVLKPVSAEQVDAWLKFVNKPLRNSIARKKEVHGLHHLD